MGTEVEGKAEQYIRKALTTPHDRLPTPPLLCLDSFSVPAADKKTCTVESSRVGLVPLLRRFSLKGVRMETRVAKSWEDQN